MKNFPHQFNDLSKFFNALAVAKQLIDKNTRLNDENFGKQLTRQGVYNYREKSLSIEKYFKKQKELPSSYRGYETASREIRRFFEYLGLLVIDENKSATLSPTAKKLLKADGEDSQNEIWQEALLNLRLEEDGQISHPYRILLKLVNKFPGIETNKLMLALEAKNDSDKEFERISNLAKKPIEQIIQKTGTTKATAANAVKILPGIAEQLGNIERINNKAYPIGQIVITEDEISTDEFISPTKTVSNFREVSAGEIAKTPNLKAVVSVSVDLAEAIKIRQKRLLEHQEVVRILAAINAKCGFKLFEGKFDCLAVKNKIALLYEIKTILENISDQEKQTVKGIGQLKYYNFSIVRKEMNHSKVKEILVFSRKPKMKFIEFCASENILVIWRKIDDFKLLNSKTGVEEAFNPNNFLK